MKSHVDTTKRLDTAPGSRRRGDLIGAAFGAIAGLVIGAGGMYLAVAPEPDRPGTGSCAEAAERFAQLDATWRVFTDTGGSPLTGGEPARIESARLAALELLEQCRAAGK